MGYLLILPSLFAIAFLGYGIFYSSRRKKMRIKYKKKWDDLLRSGFTPDMNHTYSRVVMEPDAGSIGYYYLTLDMEHGLCAYDFRAFSMIDIVKIELLSDSTVVQTASSRFGGGGLVGVVVPAVAGFGGGSQQHSGESVATVAIRLILDNRTMPSVTIPFLFNVVPKSSKSYQNAISAAYEVYGIFEGYVRYRDEHLFTTAGNSNMNGVSCTQCGATLSADAKYCSNCGSKARPLPPEMMEQQEHLKALYQNGILTKEEYDEKIRRLFEKMR